MAKCFMLIIYSQFPTKTNPLRCVPQGAHVGHEGREETFGPAYNCGYLVKIIRCSIVCPAAFIRATYIPEGSVDASK